MYEHPRECSRAGAGRHPETDPPWASSTEPRGPATFRAPEAPERQRSSRHGELQPHECLVMCPQGLLVWMCWSPCNGIMRT